MTILYVFLAVLLLGILIAVHEFGHFLFARLVGIEVQEYSIGMGPALFSRTGKHGTKYSLRAIPMGGYCAFYGEDDLTGEHRADPRAYNRQPVWKRMISVLMGPGMNFVLAFVVAAGFFAVNGVDEVLGYRPYITDVTGAGPAYMAGIRPGDLIVAVNGEKLADTDLERFLSPWKEGDAPLEVTVQRDGEEQTFRLTPYWDEALQRHRIGIVYNGLAMTKNHRVGLGTAVRAAWDWCVYAGGAILNALKNLVTTGEGLDQTSGPVGMVSMVSQEIRQTHLEGFLNWLIVISINLGLVNLLPIPGLDGARFLFMLVEAVRRKPVPPELEAKIHLGGYILLFGLMIVLTFRDITGLFR